jgi:hypothetical protein
MRKEKLMRIGIGTSALGLASIIVLAGCGKGNGGQDQVMVTDPQQAASQLERAFAASSPEVQQDAGMASEALRKGEYEKAVVSLQAIRTKENLTLDQGLAVHSSVVSMEQRLIQAMEAGDEQARRAYQMLKQMKRD